MRKFEVTLKSGETIQVLQKEVETLRNAGLLMENEQPGEESQEEETRIEPEEKPAYKLPVLTTKQRRDRIRQAKKLKRQGYSQREIARRLNVSHVAVGKWLIK